MSARFTLHGDPKFTVVRDDAETGRVEFRVTTQEGTAVVDVGHLFSDVEDMANGLEAVLKELRDDILKDWQDVPDDYDCYVTLDRGGYYVQVEQKEAPANPYPSREIAFYEAARLMAEMGAFPNAWISGEHGPASESCDDQIRRYHDEGGDQVLELPGVEYAEDDAITIDGWGAYVIRDYGDLGIVYALGGDDERRFIEDRSQVTPTKDPDDDEPMDMSGSTPGLDR